MARSDIEALRTAIVAQADAAGADGWIEIPVDRQVRDSGILRVPRGAFERWAVRPTGAEHLAAPWTIVSPQGVKQAMDDPYHTDWMLGAGLQPKDMRYGGTSPEFAEALSAAAYAAKAEIESRLLGFSCSVLVGGPPVTGRIWHPRNAGDMDIPWSDEPPVAVIRAARPDWLDMAGKVLGRGGAVIVEQGGEMAHLISVLRGEGKGPVLRAQDALKLYPEGLLVNINPGEGKITIKDDLRPPPAGASVSVLVEVDRAPARPADPAPSKFNLVRCGRDNPADNATYLRMDCGRKLQGARFDVYAVPSSHRIDDDVMELVIRVIERNPGRDRVNYYAGSRRWTDGEMLDAAYQALFLHEPQPSADELVRERRAARQARKDAFAATLAPMSDDELLAYARGKASERTEFHLEIEDGKWDTLDQIAIDADFSEVFQGIDDELERRGLPSSYCEATELPAPTL